MTSTNVQILIAVNFLHSLCKGLIAPVVSPHILEIGGNHIVVGLILTGYTICQMLSQDFMALFKQGDKYTLIFIMFSDFMSHLLTVITTSYWIVTMSRYACVVLIPVYFLASSGYFWCSLRSPKGAFFFIIVQLLSIPYTNLLLALTNQVNTTSKDFISKTEPKENQIKLFNLLDVMDTLGLVCGAIAGGYIYNNNNDFESNAILSALLSLVGALLLQSLDKDPERETIPSSIPTLPQECYKQLTNLTQVDLKANWDAFVLEMAYVTSFTIYFAKYACLIRYNYQVGIVVVGYTVAYQNMVMFASNRLVPCLKDRLGGFPANKVFHNALLLCAATLMAMYFAPTYECYLIMFVPMIIVYTFVDCLMEEDALRLKEREDVYSAIGTLIKIINIFGPFVFGVIYHIFGGKAFKLMAILPPAVCAYVINQRVIARRSLVVEQEHSHVD